MTYFELFPTINYKGTQCVDLTRRVRLTEATRNALTLYYNYTIKDGMRADIIANSYYEDPTLDWLIWLTNDTIDPYYQWNLSNDDFSSYLIKRYGSVENSQKKIALYRNNWYDDDNLITPSFYNNTLDENLRKYYQPFYDKNLKILYYKRREEDWVVATNKIYQFNTDTIDFVQGELVDVTDNLNNRVGGGEITSIIDTDVVTSIFIKSIDGAFAVGNIVTGETSNNGATITSVNLTYEAITPEEEVFWSPVTFFNIEEEKNAYARQIRILDSSHLLQATEQVRLALQS